MKCSISTSSTVQWSKIISPKEKDGLSLSTLADTNFALLYRWLWQHHSEPNTLWKKFVDAKYPCNKMGKIPSCGKFNSMNAPWCSIANGLDLFETRTDWKVNNRVFIFLKQHLEQQRSLFLITIPRQFFTCLRYKKLPLKMSGMRMWVVGI